MLWSMILCFFLLAATLNSSVNAVQSNYIKKIQIENNGKKYINPYAFSEMNFTMETLNIRDIMFTIKKGDQEVIPIRTIFSTFSPSTNVLCDANRKIWNCSTSSSDLVAYETLWKNKPIKLYSNYDAAGLNFSREGSKYLLKISSNFSPVDGKSLCPFLMEWPSSVTLQEPQEHVPKVEIPQNYESCEDSVNCDFLKGENGVKFGSKGTVEFTIALLDKEREFKLLHSFGYFSPIFTLNDSFFCSKYSTKITFNDLNYILFKRDGEKIDIETGSLTHENLPILKESNVQFYFYNNFIYCTFFDPRNHFQLHTFELSDRNGGNVLSIKIDYKSSVKRCNGIVKLIVRNGVKLLFPKSITSLTTFNKPINSTPTANVNETNKTGIATTTKATQTASFPLWAIIVISCVGVFILICGLVLLICCLIKKRKNKSPKKTENLSISEMERRMLAKKKKSKNDNDQNNIPAVLCDTPAIDFPKPKKSIDEVPKLDKQNNDVEKEIIKKKEEEKSYEKPSRFDPEFVKSLLPPGAYIPPNYYEENPIKDETIDYGSLARTFTLTDGFWTLFPFIRVNPNNDYLLQNNPFLQYQFVIRDLSLPENKIFHKFGARLFEPIDEEIVSPEEGKEPPKKLIPVVIRTFILCKDPPAIECIVHGRYPGFFTNMLDCKSCDTNRRPRFFDEDQLSRLSQCLREVPLGHHINTVVGNDRKFLFDKTGKKYPIKTIFVVKGAEQIVPLNLQYSSCAHPNGFKIRTAKPKKAIKNPPVKKKSKIENEEEEGNSKDITKKTEKSRKTNTYDRDGTDPTQFSVQTTQKNTFENEKTKTGITKTFDHDASTQPSL